MPQTSVRSGLLMIVLGVWVILRTTRHDSNATAQHPHGQTLVDHILGSGSASSSTATGQSPALARLSAQSLQASQTPSGISYGIAHPLAPGGLAPPGTLQHLLPHNPLVPHR